MPKSSIDLGPFLPYRAPTGVIQVAKFEWNLFLESFSRDLLAHESICSVLTSEVIKSGWLGFDPARIEEVQELEEKLGLRLPDSYRNFLMVSNGWRATGLSTDRVFGVDEVRHFRVDNQEWITAYLNPLEGIDDEFIRGIYADELFSGSKLNSIPDSEYFVYGERQAPPRYEYLQNAIQISAVGDAVYLLCPDGVSRKGEYEAWFFANWIPGGSRFDSFQQLMIDQRRSLLRHLSQNP